MVAQVISFLLRSGARVFVAVGGYWQRLPDLTATRRQVQNGENLLAIWLVIRIIPQPVAGDA